MSIDWGKIQQKKDKDHKIRGTALLEMKEKLASQEKEINELKQSSSSLTGKVDGIKVSLESTVSEKDKQIKALINEKNELQKRSDAKIASLESEVQELQTSLDAAKAELSDLDALKKERDELAKNTEILEDELRGRDFDYFKKYIKEKSTRASQTFGQQAQTQQEDEEQ